MITIDGCTNRARPSQPFLKNLPKWYFSNPAWYKIIFWRAGVNFFIWHFILKCSKLTLWEGKKSEKLEAQLKSRFLKNRELCWSDLPQNSNLGRESFVQKSGVWIPVGEGQIFCHFSFFISPFYFVHKNWILKDKLYFLYINRLHRNKIKFVHYTYLYW